MRRAVVVSCLLAAGSAPARDLAELKAGGVLRVIVAREEQPETFALQLGTEPGFERELLELFARRQGLALEPLAVKGHADRIPALLAGQGDLIAAIFDTPERRAKVDFTGELMPTYNVAVTHVPRPPMTDLAELRAAKVGVIGGTQPAQEALAAGIPPGSLQKLERLEALLEALQKGSLDAAVLPVSEFVLAARRAPGLQAGLTLGPRGSVAWAVRKQDGQLRQALDEFLLNARRGGTWSRLIAKYFGDRALKVLGRER